jgi:hypothetical protein
LLNFLALRQGTFRRINGPVGTGAGFQFLDAEHGSGFLSYVFCLTSSRHISARTGLESGEVLTPLPTPARACKVRMLVMLGRFQERTTATFLRLINLPSKISTCDKPVIRSSVPGGDSRTGLATQALGVAARFNIWLSCWMYSGAASPKTKYRSPSPVQDST